MMPGEAPDLGAMFEKISQNPQASAMLANLLGGRGGSPAARQGDNASLPTDGAVPGDGTAPTGGAADSAEAKHPGEGEAVSVGAFSLPPPPPAHGQGHGHGKARREMLLALRPYLGERRCASVDRMIRALELYDILEETHLLKGGH